MGSPHRTAHCSPVKTRHHPARGHATSAGRDVTGPALGAGAPPPHQTRTRRPRHRLRAFRAALAAGRGSCVCAVLCRPPQCPPTARLSSGSRTGHPESPSSHAACHLPPRGPHGSATCLRHGCPGPRPPHTDRVMGRGDPRGSLRVTLSDVRSAYSATVVTSPAEKPSNAGGRHPVWRETSQGRYWLRRRPRPAITSQPAQRPRAKMDPQTLGRRPVR